MIKFCWYEGWDSEAIRNVQVSRIDTDQEDETFFAVKAMQQLLAKEQLDISEIGALICSTGTPLSMTPSLACRP